MEFTFTVWPWINFWSRDSLIAYFLLDCYCYEQSGPIRTVNDNFGVAAVEHVCDPPRFHMVVMIHQKAAYHQSNETEEEVHLFFTQLSL